jgi:hypothetical protein
VTATSEPDPSNVEGPAEPPPVATPTGNPSLETVRAAWQESILAGLRPKVRAIFQAGRFEAVEGEVAILTVPNDAHLLHAEPLRAELETTMTSYFGSTIKIRLISETSGRDQSNRSSTTEVPSSRRPSSPRASSAAPPNAATVPQPDDDVDASDEDFADLIAPMDTDDRTAAASSGIEWARERVLEAFPGAEEV